VELVEVCNNTLCFLFYFTVCFEFTGKKTESVKLPWQSIKKRASGITADSKQKVTKAHGSKKDIVGVSVKEKMSDKTRESVDGGDNARKFKHDRTRYVECRTNQNIKASTKDGSKKHRMVDVNTQQLQECMRTKEVDYGDSLLQKYLVPDSFDSVKKVKRCDSDSQVDQAHEETKVCTEKLVECQKKENSGLQQCCTIEQVSMHNKLQLLERHQKAGGNVDKKSYMDLKVEVRGSSKETAQRGGRRAGVDTSCSAARNAGSSNSARQHVRHALYRALSSR